MMNAQLKAPSIVGGYNSHLNIDTGDYNQHRDIELVPRQAPSIFNENQPQLNAWLYRLANTINLFAEDNSSLTGDQLRELVCFLGACMNESVSIPQFLMTEEATVGIVWWPNDQLQIEIEIMDDLSIEGVITRNAECEVHEGIDGLIGPVITALTEAYGS